MYHYKFWGHLSSSEHVSHVDEHYCFLSFSIAHLLVSIPAPHPSQSLKVTFLACFPFSLQLQKGIPLHVLVMFCLQVWQKQNNIVIMSWDLKVRQTWARIVVQPLSSTWNSGGSFTGSTGFCGLLCTRHCSGLQRCREQRLLQWTENQCGRQTVNKGSYSIPTGSIFNKYPEMDQFSPPHCYLRATEPWDHCTIQLFATASILAPEASSQQSIRAPPTSWVQALTPVAPALHREVVVLLQPPSPIAFSLLPSSLTGPPGLCSSLCGLSLTPFTLCWDTPFPVSLCLSDT